MLRITNGRDVFEVSSGAFSTIYKKQGFRVLEENNGSTAVATQQAVVENVEAESEDALEEKPISQWSKAEVKSYAEKHNIDLTGTRNVNEAKEIIKAAMAN